MRKIKSVKLKKDYSTPHHFYEKGTNLKIDVPKNNLVCLSGSYYSPEAYPDFFKIEYEEETKYIDVRIEYEYDSSNSSLPLTANNLEAHFDIATELKNVKVTELPEVFTREEINTMFPSTHMTANLRIDNFLSERKSK